VFRAGWETVRRTPDSHTRSAARARKPGCPIEPAARGESAGLDDQRINVDGALPDDISRGCPFQWPPCHTGYAWEGLSGAVMQAEILHRAGYDAYNWENQAIRRATAYLMYLDQQFGGWWTDDDDEQWVPWIVNRAYGTAFRNHRPARTGKNMAWTDWTHAGLWSITPDVVSPAPHPHLRPRASEAWAGQKLAGCEAGTPNETTPPRSAPARRHHTQRLRGLATLTGTSFVKASS